MMREGVSGDVLMQVSVQGASTGRRAGERRLPPVAREAHGAERRWVHPARAVRQSHPTHVSMSDVCTYKVRWVTVSSPLRNC